MNVRPSHHLQRWQIFVLKGFLAVGVLWLLMRIVDPSEIAQALQHARWTWVLAAIVCIPVHLFFRIVRWKTILRAAGEIDDLPHAARTVLIGYAMSQVTPGEVGDYVARTRIHGTISPARVIGLTVVDKAIHAGLIVVIGIPAFVYIMTWSVVWSILSCVVTIIALLAGLAFAPRLIRDKRLDAIAHRAKLSEGVEALRSISRATAQRIIVVTSLILLTYVVQEYLLLNAVGSASVMQTWVGFWSGLAVRTAAPFFLAELGIREATHVYFFGRLDISATVAISTSLLVLGVNVLLPSVLGIFMMFVEGRRRK